MTALTEGLVSAREFGLMTILPALLVFAIIYGILMKTKVLGENQWINMLVSVMTAIIFVALVKAVNFTNEFIPLMSIVLVIVVFMFMLFRFVGVEGLAKGGGKIALAVIGAIIVLVISTVAFKKVFTTSYAKIIDALSGFGTALVEPSVLAIIVLFGTFIAAAFLIVRQA